VGNKRKLLIKVDTQLILSYVSQEIVVGTEVQMRFRILFGYVTLEICARHLVGMEDGYRNITLRQSWARSNNLGVYIYMVFKAVGKDGFRQGENADRVNKHQVSIRCVFAGEVKKYCRITSLEHSWSL
jgi:hypothetical protein